MHKSRCVSPSLSPMTLVMGQAHTKSQPSPPVLGLSSRHTSLSWNGGVAVTTATSRTLGLASHDSNPHADAKPPPAPQSTPISPSPSPPFTHPHIPPSTRVLYHSGLCRRHVMDRGRCLATPRLNPPSQTGGESPQLGQLTIHPPTTTSHSPAHPTHLVPPPHPQKASSRSRHGEDTAWLQLRARWLPLPPPPPPPPAPAPTCPRPRPARTTGRRPNHPMHASQWTPCTTRYPSWSDQCPSLHVCQFDPGVPSQ